MNAHLEQAFAAAALLPDAAQEALATVIFEELAVERGWEERFTRTQGRFGDLVARARAEADRGEICAFDPATRPQDDAAIR